MPDSTSAPSPLPPEVAERLANRLNSLSDDLFKAWDEAGEFGGNFLLVKMTCPATGREMQLLLAPPDIDIHLDRPVSASRAAQQQ